MISLLLTSLAFMAAQPAAQMTPPADWSTLPDLPLRHRDEPAPDIGGYARAEVQAGRCRAGRIVDGTASLQVDLAVLVAADGGVRRIVPRAIDCPTVEQFAAGLVLRAARDDLAVPLADADAWYRTSLTFSWRP